LIGKFFIFGVFWRSGTVALPPATAPAPALWPEKKMNRREKRELRFEREKRK
jgi:hypothetical protein